MEDVTDLVYETAFFWRMNPREAHNLTLREIARYHNHYERILERYGTR